MRRLDATIALLRDCAREVDLHRTEAPGHARELALEITREGRAGAIIAAGGDGTVNEIVDGLNGPELPLGLIPTGTANVLARELGVPRDPASIARILNDGDTRVLRAATWQGNGRGHGRGSLVLMAGAGFDARAVAGVRPGVKRLIGKGAYALSGIRQWLRGYPHTIEIVADGRVMRAGWVVVANARHYAGGFVIARDADIGRADFEVVCLAGGSRFRLLLQTLWLLCARIHRAPGAECVRASSVILRAPVGAPAQIDGDACATLPMTIEPRCDTLRVIAPVLRAQHQEERYRTLAEKLSE